ncbi:hypothetical protein A3Q56_08296 [Intoshia linei]|uniref:Uncharacterized protein n=1 Tax=Intoshia linei TaxID=1819745 RepID=A0A177AQC6_9BILA|nr:hypothetical protein A3Q56_08296 [Intoshia linei]
MDMLRNRVLSIVTLNQLIQYSKDKIVKNIYNEDCDSNCTKAAFMRNVKILEQTVEDCYILGCVCKSDNLKMIKSKSSDTTILRIYKNENNSLEEVTNVQSSRIKSKFEKKNFYKMVRKHMSDLKNERTQMCKRESIIAYHDESKSDTMQSDLLNRENSSHVTSNTPCIRRKILLDPGFRKKSISFDDIVNKGDIKTDKFFEGSDELDKNTIDYLDCFPSKFKDEINNTSVQGSTITLGLLSGDLYIISISSFEHSCSRDFKNYMSYHKINLFSDKILLLAPFNEDGLLIGNSVNRYNQQYLNKMDKTMTEKDDTVKLIAVTKEEIYSINWSTFEIFYKMKHCELGFIDCTSANVCYLAGYYIQLLLQYIQ